MAAVRKAMKGRRAKSSRPAVPGLIRERLRSVREFLNEKRLDGFLITSRADQFYLTGFNGEDGLALVTPGQVYLLSDFRFETLAGQGAPWAKFIQRKKSHAEELAKLARRGKMARIGFDADCLTVAAASELRKALRPVGTRLVQVPSVTAKLRIQKSPAEVEILREAIRIAQEAFVALRRSIRIGQTEQELASRLNYEMGRRGASGPSFPTVVAEGPNSALPHAEPGTRVVKRGSAVLFDWGARHNGYCSDLTRVLFVGRIPPRFRRLYEIVLEAQQRGIQALRVGRPIREVDQAARSHIVRSGYGKRFGHALGHGLGLDIHESPGLSARNRDPLECGMVVTVEPGIYVPGFGGVRIEDDVLITETGSDDGSTRGCEVLSTLPKDLGWAVLDL